MVVDLAIGDPSELGASDKLLVLIGGHQHNPRHPTSCLTHSNSGKGPLFALKLTLF